MPKKSPLQKQPTTKTKTKLSLFRIKSKYITRTPYAILLIYQWL